MNEISISPVRARLQAHRQAHSGSRTETLKQTGIICTVPKFINHGAWMRAQRIGKGDIAKSQAAFICETVLFEGEKLTITDLAELVPSADTLQLIGLIFGGEEDGGADEGNAVTVS